jgi:hypothetical protein
MSNRGAIKYFRASGAAVDEVNLLTREGIIGHLAVLEPDASCAAALPAFLGQASPDGDPCEFILIMADDAFQDPEMQAAFRDCQHGSLFVATVNRAGAFRRAH